MQYFGAKGRLLGWVFPILSDNLKSSGIPVSQATFMDACAGTSAMGAQAVRYGYKQVVSCDLMLSAYYVAQGKMGLPDALLPEVREHLYQMNNIPGVEGYFFRTYSESAGRLYLGDESARRVDACREYINGITDPAVKSYLTYCLLEAFSRVSNTVGTQGAFQKQLSSKSKVLFVKEEPRVQGTVIAYRESFLDVLRDEGRQHEDVLYIDPPYNNRQYPAFYHLYETIAYGDEPSVGGVTGCFTRAESRSNLCTKEGLCSALSEAIRFTTASVAAISYSSDGAASLTDLEKAVSEAVREDSHIEIHVKPFPRFVSRSNKQKETDNTRTGTLREYLIVVRPQGTTLSL